jgi:hypothetical protein
MSEQTDQPDPIESMFKLSKRSSTEAFFYLVMQIVDLKEQVVALQDENHRLKDQLRAVKVAPSE